jgi:hypothetical protein
MKKKLFFLAISLFAAVTTQAQTNLMKYVNKTYELPDKYFDFYTSGKSDSIYSHLSSTVKQVLTADNLRQQFAMLDQVLGKPVETGMWKQEEQEGYKIYSRDLTFAHYTAKFTIVLNQEGIIETYMITEQKPITVPKDENDREITIKSDGPELPARLSLPKDSKGKLPVVILVHGSGANDMNETIGANAPFRDLSKGLNEKGIAVIRYNKRSLVDATSVKDYDSETVNDAVAAVELAAQMHEIDSNRIYVLGHSLGGQLAPRIAEKCNKIKGIIIWAGNTRKLKSTLEEQLKYLGVAEKNLEETVNQQLSVLPAGYLDFDNQYSPTETARKLNIPMLVMQGESDYNVTMEDFNNWKTALKDHKNVIFKSYPKLNHLFFKINHEGMATSDDTLRPNQHVEENVIQDIAKFINAGK